MRDRCKNWQLRDPALVLERTQARAAKIVPVAPAVVVVVRDRYYTQARRLRIREAMKKANEH